MRTELTIQIRDFLPERGIAVPQGKANSAVGLPRLLKDAEIGLVGRMRQTIDSIAAEWSGPNRREAELDREAALESKRSEGCRRLNGVLTSAH